MKKIILSVLLLFTLFSINNGVFALDLGGFDEEDVVRGVADVLQYTPLNTSNDYYQAAGPFDTYSVYVLYYDISHVGPVYFFFGNDLADNYNFVNVFEMGFFNFNGLGTMIAQTSLESFKYNHVLDNYRAPYVVQNDTSKTNTSFYGMSLLSPVDLLDIGFYIMIDAQIGTLAMAETYATNEIIPYIYRADSIGELHPQYEQNIYNNGYLDAADATYTDGFNDARSIYAYYDTNTGIYQTAGDYGQSKYNEGYSDSQSQGYGIDILGTITDAAQFTDHVLSANLGGGFMLYHLFLIPIVFGVLFLIIKFSRG